MNSDLQTISAVPTNIITGFLGAGKTTAILHLLKQKPDGERWAVLVNEFGEIGVDGSLFAGKHSTEDGVFIREVPGGCMCCAAGVPMQVALNQLLKKADPDRLLIEPTGLGHPEEVLQVLLNGTFRDSLDLQKILTLVDARKLSDARYTEHQTFNQQLAIADIIVGNKVDLYQGDECRMLEQFVKDRGWADAQVLFTQDGVVSPECLSGTTTADSRIGAKAHHHHHAAEQKEMASEIPMPECGYVLAENQGEGFFSVGLRVSPSKQFDHQKLFSFLKGIEAERLKAVFATNAGFFGYNLTQDALVEEQLRDCKESRVEVISRLPGSDLKTQLFRCLAE